MTGTRVRTHDPSGAAVPARPASTVMLLRDGPAGVEVFMLRRQTTMAFAPGALVFPGGAVDPQDSDPSMPWAGPEPAQWAHSLDLSETRARAHVSAAVRETFEECGVLLASPAQGAPGRAQRAPADGSRAADRERLLTGEHTLAELLTARGMVLRSDLLRPWAHWVTPATYPRRYDTRFFLARCPEHQRPEHVGGESAESRWWSAAGALRAAQRGEVHLMYPTRACLQDLAAAATVEQLLTEPT